MLDINAQRQRAGLRWLRHHFYFKSDNDSRILETFDDVTIWLKANIKRQGIVFERDGARNSEGRQTLQYLLSGKRCHRPKAGWYAGLGAGDFMVYFQRRQDAKAFAEAFKITNVEVTEQKQTRHLRRNKIKEYLAADERLFFGGSHYRRSFESMYDGEY